MNARPNFFRILPLLGALVTTLAVAATTELDSDLMQNIEDSNKSLASNIAIKDIKASTSDTRDLKQMFAQVETYFAAKPDAANGLDLTRKSIDLLADIDKNVSSKNFDAATDAATTLSRTCKTCHNFYKKES